MEFLSLAHHRKQRLHPARSRLRFFSGLEPPGNCIHVGSVECLEEDENLSVTDGPYIESKEHVGGFWIVKAADMNEALEWGRKAARACRAPVEVRAFL